MDVTWMEIPRQTPSRDRDWIVQSPILYLYPRRPTSVYPKFQKQLIDFRVPFVPDTFSVQAEGASVDPRPVLISPDPRRAGRRYPSETCLPGYCESGRPRRGKPHGIAVSP